MPRSQRAGVGQRPRTVRVAPPAGVADPLTIDVSVIDERARRRHRGPVFEIEHLARDRSSASPIRALFDPRAVLSSMKALFPAEYNADSGAGRADLPGSRTRSRCRRLVDNIRRSRTPAVPNPALPAHVEERLVGAGAGRQIFEPVLSSAAAVTLSGAESAALPIERASPLVSVPRHGQARSAVAADEVETDGSVIDERAGRRHRGLVVEPENSPGADRSEPGQSAVRPQRRAVLDEGVVSVQVQLRVSRQAGDLTRS